ncbi:S8 family serine peptidase [uncultured Cellulomonas sp.]|uniref:S8 family serine peptidase n=1 Tax=uncultured Cellulomonas sp. TaxID=189682 RepID=UPI00260E9A20|nr:S8 family serine peptidase [uncultured Cellulomonas sp.]
MRPVTATVAALVGLLGVSGLTPAAAAGAPAPLPAASRLVPTPDPGWSEADGAMLRIPRAWQVTAGRGVTVAVVDSGVQAGHPELAGALLPGVDLVGADPQPDDVSGHGTAVAGVIAGRLDGAGSMGVAYEATILPIKVTEGHWQTPGADDVVASGVRAATARGADVIHVSQATPTSSGALRDAVVAAIAAGAVVVVPMGDAPDGTPRYPAAWASELPGLVAVARSDDDRSPESRHGWGDWATVAAPGANVTVPTQGDGYGPWSTDGLASARVAGVVALVRAHEPGLDPAQVVERLERTAQDAAAPGADPYYGSGVVDAAAAVTLGDAVPAAPGLAFDRPLGDGGQDDVMAGARPLARTEGAGGQVDGTFDAEGDIDWYTFDPGSSARHRVSVRGAVVDVHDRDGAYLLTVDDRPSLGDRTDELDGPGPWYLRVRSEDPRDLGSYGVGLTLSWAQPTTTVRFDRGVTTESDPGDWVNGDVQLADVTGDGHLDAVVGTAQFVPHPEGGAGIAPVVGLSPGRGDGTFGPYQRVPVGTLRGLSPSVTTVDLDGDGVAEVVAATDAEVWTLDLSGVAPVTRRVAGYDGGYARRLVAADLDGDGDQDLAGRGLVLHNDGTGGLAPTPLPAVTPVPVPDLGRPAAADVDGDGRLDLVHAEGAVLAQGADGSFVAAPSIAWLAGSAVVRAGDVSGDGRPDLVAGFADGTLRLARATADGWEQPVTVTSSGQPSDRIELLDVDADGRTDIASSPPGATVLGIQQRDGGFHADAFVLSPSPDYGYAAALADLDGDGLADLVGTDGGELRVARQGAVRPGATPGVLDVTPVTSSRGVGTRPTVEVALGADVDPASVSAQTVRLVDSTTRAPVRAVLRVTDGVVRLVPVADLVAGRSYGVHVAGLRTRGGATSEPFRSWFTVAAGGDRFTPVEPTRVFDSRDGFGPAEPGYPIQLSFDGLVPADTTAVVLNLTAVDPSALGNVRVYPTTEDGVPPQVSSLNVVPGSDQPAGVTVGLGLDLSVDLLVDGAVADLVVDVAGYYSPTGATAFTSTAPVRVLDTRDGTGGVPSRPVGAGRWVELQVTGRAGVPTDASAVALNVTATQVAARTHVRVYPSPAASEDGAPPEVSNLNLDPGRDQANMVVVRVGDGGRIRLYTHSAPLDLVVDLAGWYSGTGELGFVPVDPARIVDSRYGVGLPRALRAGTPAEVVVGGVAGVPPGAPAAVLTITGTGQRTGTHIRTFPVTDPRSLPLVSTLNMVARRDEANATIARIGLGGRIGVYSQSADLDLVVDVSGYFTR